ncbi:MAG: hypothetical protein ACLFR7_06400, partial [Opitutales bacterium]
MFLRQNVRRFDGEVHEAGTLPEPVHGILSLKADGDVGAPGRRRQGAAGVPSSAGNDGRIRYLNKK